LDAIDKFDAAWRKKYGTGEAGGVSELTEEKVKALQEEQKRQENEAAQREGLEPVEKSFVGALGAEVARHITSDPKKITATAKAGLAAEGVFLAVAAAKGQTGMYSPDVEGPGPLANPVGPWRHSGQASTPPPSKVAPPPTREPIPTPGPVAFETKSALTTATATQPQAKAAETGKPRELTAQPKAATRTSLGIPIEEDLEAGLMQPAGKREAGMAEKPQHHIFPQELEKQGFWRDRGFAPNEIDKYCVELPEAEHQAQHGGGNPWLGREWEREWNSEITVRILEAEQGLGRKLTKKEVLDIGKQMQKDRGIDLPYVKWRGSRGGK